MQALLEILYTNNLSKSYKEPVRYTSVALCAVGTSVILRYLRPLRDPMCPLYKPFNLSSIFGRTFYYPVTMSFIILLPCLEYPVTMSSITLLPCLEYPVTMSLITLYHVFHYPVTMSLITLFHVSHYPVTMSLITLSHVSHYPVSCLPLPCYYVSYYPVSIKECKTTKKKLTS